MANSVTRELVDAFYEAYASQEPGRVAPFLHDDVEWTISGPVDVLSFCGTRHGKAAVADLSDRVIPGVFRVVSFSQDSIVMDGDRVATLNHMLARGCANDRTISYRLAHFFHFCDGRIIKFVSLLDSFDAAEQMLGRRFDVDVAAPTDLPELTDVGGIVAV
ncbi:MAG: nuclear transport factor 2 family protein [Pseudolabrys sp.]|nr:nuclear transport factor 2 family protein [Pseudolabrys sp.]